jgi:hypothetical protein
MSRDNLKTMLRIMPVSRRTGVSRPSVPSQTQPSRPAHTQAAPAQHAPAPAPHHATAPPAMMPPSSSGPGMMGQVNQPSYSLTLPRAWNLLGFLLFRRAPWCPRTYSMCADCRQCGFYCRWLSCCARSKVRPRRWLLAWLSRCACPCSHLVRRHLCRLSRAMLQPRHFRRSQPQPA